jgi:hypothetical protein
MLNGHNLAIVYVLASRVTTRLQGTVRKPIAIAVQMQIILWF